MTTKTKKREDWTFFGNDTSRLDNPMYPFLENEHGIVGPTFKHLLDVIYGLMHWDMQFRLQDHFCSEKLRILSFVDFVTLRYTEKDDKNRNADLSGLLSVWLTLATENKRSLASEDVIKALQRQLNDRVTVTVEMKGLLRLASLAKQLEQLYGKDKERDGMGAEASILINKFDSFIDEFKQIFPRKNALAIVDELIGKLGRWDSNVYLKGECVSQFIQNMLHNPWFLTELLAKQLPVRFPGY